MDDNTQLDAKRLTGIRILAADDVEVNRLVLEDLLIQEGADIVLVEDGSQVVELIERSGQDAFHLILMDVQMPVMDGLEASRRILQISPDIPIIGLTAHELVAEQQRCLDAGMVDHVTKPVDEDTLVNVISRYVVSHSESDADEDFDFDEASTDDVDRTSVIDWAALRDRYQGREHFIDKLVASALRSQSDVPSHLRRLANDGHVEQIGRLAHSIKSLAGNLEAHNLEHLAMQTETCVLVGNDSASYVALELAAALDELIQVLQASDRDS